VKSRDSSIEDFLPRPLRPADRAYLRRLRRHQAHLARYAVSTGWSADAAKWLSQRLEFHEALDRMAVAERRSPSEVATSLLSFPPMPAKRTRRRP
jgi:hypothetical protein